MHRLEFARLYKGFERRGLVVGDIWEDIVLLRVYKAQY